MFSMWDGSEPKRRKETQLNSTCPHKPLYNILSNISGVQRLRGHWDVCMPLIVFCVWADRNKFSVLINKKSRIVRTWAQIVLCQVLDLKFSSWQAGFPGLCWNSTLEPWLNSKTESFYGWPSSRNSLLHFPSVSAYRLIFFVWPCVLGLSLLW